MKKKYLDNIYRIEKECLSENKDVFNNDFSENKLDFLRFKSGYQKLFSNRKFSNEELLKSFLSVKVHQAIAENDFNDERAFHKINIPDFSNENNPIIFCSFHLGSYTILPILLAKYKTLLIVNKKTHFSKYEKFINVAKSNNICDFDIIDAEENSSIIKIIRKVKQGFSPFFYIDGNTGIGGFERNDKKLEEITFLGQRLLSRKGVAFLAYKLNLDIIPIYTYRENNQNIILTDPVINRQNVYAYSMDEFCSKCTQILWNLFEKTLIKHPDQWEGWLYVQNFLNKETKYMNILSINEDDVKYSILKFSTSKNIFVKKGRFYIYDYYSSQIFEISKIIFIILLNLKNKKLNISFYDLQKILSKKTILTLINNQILFR